MVNPAQAQVEYNFDADNLKVNRTSGRAQLTGNVRVNNETEVLTADTVQIYFRKQLNEVRRITARGQVRIKRDTWLAEADYADYYPGPDTGLLRGNGYLRRGGSELWGERISFDESRGWLQVESNVRGVIKRQREEKGDD